MRTVFCAAVVTAVTAAFAVVTAPVASANAERVEGPVTIRVIGEGLTVVETMTFLQVDHDFPGNLQAYYLIVPPGRDVSRAEKHWSSHITQGPLRPGLARDSHGPTGGFLDGTQICAAWWDPTGREHIPGFPCVTIGR
ncbi:hypothetical protein [Nocardia alni]|uniref:hypothetical protein n=1 Tax=Nocardia alni TaxID=2815723 RepID=UPI001C23ABE6|nr:hypothetical protein [Nocardia alni]